MTVVCVMLPFTFPLFVSAYYRMSNQSSRYFINQIMGLSFQK